MYCCNTGELESIFVDKGKLTHVPDMRSAEAEKIGLHMGAVRSYGHGNGRICLPLINGFLKHLETTFTDYFEGLRKKTN